MKKSRKNIDSKARAISLLQSGKLNACRTICERLLTMDDTDAETWCLLAVICGKQRAFADAARFSQRAVDIAPEYFQARSILGRALYEMQHYSKSVEQLNQVLVVQPGNAEALLYCGYAYRELNEIPMALKHFEATVQLQPSNVDALCIMANIYENMHEYTRAGKLLDAVLALDPGYPAAILAKAVQDRREGQLEMAKARLVSLLEKKLPGHYRANVANELAHILDQLDQYDDAFDAFEQSQQISAEKYSDQFDMDTTFTEFEKKRKVLVSLDVQSWPDDYSDDGLSAPIFLVGFPRSGTTLTEQILAAHPSIFTSDEELIIRDTVNAIPELTNSEYTYPECVNEFSTDDVLALRQQYWKLVRTKFDYNNKQRFLDKVPLNIQNLVFIHRLFPDAQIVYVQRDPRDACLSCFFQLFRLNQSMIHFTNLKDTVNFYREMMGLWQLSIEKLKLNVFEVKYETLTTEFEQVSRQLIEFLEEEWNESVLDFHKTAKQRFISTPSARAVSKPVNTQAIGRWKNYRKHIEPMLGDLEEYVQRFGYTI